MAIEIRSLVKNWFMNWWRPEPTVAQQVEQLEKSQRDVDERRHMIEGSLQDLAQRRDTLKATYKQTSGEKAKRQLLTQMADMDQQMQLMRENHSILGKQSALFARQAHNLQIAQTANTPNLPTSEQLTSAGASAEVALESLDERFETSQTVCAAVSDVSMTKAEAAIQAEIEAEIEAEAEQGQQAPEIIHQSERQGHRSREAESEHVDRYYNDEGRGPERAYY